MAEQETKWPITMQVAILAAAVALASTVYQGYSAQKLARQKFQYDLFLSATNTDDPQVAAKRLELYVSLGYLDSTVQIENFIKHPDRIPISGHQNFPDRP